MCSKIAEIMNPIIQLPSKLQPIAVPPADIQRRQPFSIFTLWTVYIMLCRTLDWTCVWGWVGTLFLWGVTPKSNCPSSGWVGTLLAADQPQPWFNGQSVAAEVWWLMPILINPITQSNNSWWICGVWHPSIYYTAVLCFSFLPVSNNSKLLFRQYNCYTYYLMTQTVISAAHTDLMHYSHIWNEHIFIPVLYLF